MDGNTVVEMLGFVMQSMVAIMRCLDVPLEVRING